MTAIHEKNKVAAPRPETGRGSKNGAEAVSDMNDRALGLRGDFPILSSTVGRDKLPLVYLDNAATTQKPRSVIDAISGYYERDNSNVHRSIHELGERATALYEAARERARLFVGAESADEIVFTRGTTEAINLVAYSFCAGLKPGDEILLTQMEHHANIVSWQIAARLFGLVVKFVGITDSGELRLEDYERLVGPRTKMVAVTQMSNVLGTVNPIAKIAGIAHSKGIPLLVDAAQGAAHEGIDVASLGADFLAFSGHKAAGPMGIGVLYGKREFLERMTPWQGGGEMIRTVTLEGFEPNDLPYKFEAGTPNVEGAVGLHAALDYLDSVGTDWIREWEKVLSERAIAGLRSIPGLEIFGSARERGGIVSFEVPGIHAHDMAAFLDSRGIAIRAGHHCAHPLAQRLGVVSTARASFFLYNTLSEVDFFIQTVDEARRRLS
jgi:cysteine desulfurase / selenocysteine lyase